MPVLIAALAGIGAGRDGTGAAPHGADHAIDAARIVPQRAGPGRTGAPMARAAGPADVSRPAAAAPAAFYVLQPARSRVWFEARATLGGFTGETRHVQGWAEFADTAAFTDARGRVEIQVAAFRTGIGMRDRHLRETMEAEQYPKITFVLDRVERTADPRPRADSGDARDADVRDAPDVGSRARPGTPVRLSGSLTMKATTRDVDIPAVVDASADTLAVRGRLATRLTRYGIEPPSRFLGVAGMDDEITLAFEVVFAAR